jgi:protein SCO1/2
MTTNTLARSRRCRWSTWLTRALYGAMAAAVAVVLAFNIWQPIRVLPRVSLAPGFAFTNQDGERRTSEDYRGKLTIYNFTYTRCGESCPQTSAQMQALRQQLARAAPQELSYALVTLTLDPERDTPAVLKLYAAQYQDAPADKAPWDWLTGDPLRMKYAVGGGFSVYYEPDASGAVTFEPRFVLVDGWGIIRAEYRTIPLDPQRVLRDIDYLTREARSSQGAARLAYEAAHLFRCYP